MKDHKIRKRTKNDDPELLRIWESAVRASHHFLAPEDIGFFRPMVEGSLGQIEVYVAADEEGRPVAFLGMDGKHIEMLFVDPKLAGQGIGSSLMEYAVGQRGADSVDVNEQNGKTVEFYLKKGFRVAGRDQTDPSGKPYPILHLVR